MSVRRIVALIAVALVALLVFSHPGRVAVKTLLLLPSLFPNAAVRPLEWVSGDPWKESFGYDYAAGPVQVDVYHPASAGPHGAVVVVLGAGSRPKEDPALVQFAQGLARAGAVVMIPESETLRLGHVQPADADMLVTAFQRLRALPDVDPARVGYVGFSIGGGLTVLAAEDPRIRDQVAFVNTVGAYFDAPIFLEEIATRSIEQGGERRRWEPSEHTVRMFRLQLVTRLQDPRDREIFESMSGGGKVEGSLSPQGEAVRRLLEGVPPEELAALLVALPPGTIEHLASISPAAGIASLRARLYVMHDVNDTYIPVTQSRYLVNELRPATLIAYTEFDIFRHATPDKSTDTLTFLLNVARLYGHVFQVCQEFL